MISILTSEQIFPNSNTRSKSRGQTHTLQTLSGGISSRPVSEKPLPGYPQDPSPVISEAVQSRVLSEKLQLSFPVGTDDATFSVRPDTVPSRSRSLSDTSRQHRHSIDYLSHSPKTITARGCRATRFAGENSYYDEMTRPMSAPSISQKPRRHSADKLARNPVQVKSPFRMALEPLVQFEKRKALTSTNREDRRIKLLHRSKSRTFDIFGLSGTKEQMRRRSRPNMKAKPFRIFRPKSSNDLTGTTQWSHFGRGNNNYSTTSDDQMTWSHEVPGVQDTYTFKPNPGGSPQFPHLIFVTDSPDQHYLDGELKDDSSVDSEGESRLTALPSLGPPLVSLEDDPASPSDASPPLDNAIRDERTTILNLNAQLASSKYSDIKDQNSEPFRVSNLKMLPSRNPALDPSDSVPGTGSDGRHVVSQSHNWLMRRPSLFSLRSSRKGSEVQSLASAESSVSNPRSKPSSTGVAIMTAADFPSTQIRIPSLIDECPRSAGSSKQFETGGSRARLGLGINIGAGNDPDDLYNPGIRPPPGPGGRAMVSPNYGAQSALKGEKHTKFRSAFDEGARRLLSPKRSLKGFLLGTSSKDTTNTNIMSGSGSVIQAHRAANPVQVRIGGGLTNDLDDEKFYYHRMEKNGTWVTR